MESILAVTVHGRWRPGIGDPTAIGWVTVVAYCLAALLCGLVAWRIRQRPTPRGRTLLAFWTGLAVMMVLLGVNKQLDLQSLFTQIGRDLAIQHGWYDQRQFYQREFIVWLIVLGVLGFTVLLLLLVGTWRQTGLALCGLIFLLVFILARAASFHHVDFWLGLRWGGVKLNGLLELSGIGAIALAAGRNLIPLRCPSPRQ